MNQCQEPSPNGLTCKLPAGHHHHEDEVGTLYDLSPGPTPPQSGPPYWASDDHALRAGFLIGALIHAGIDAYPNVDDEGNYTNVIVVKLDEADPEMMVKISVLPPA